MRIPGWLFVSGVVVMVGLTLLCSVISFTAAQRLVVDLSSSGVPICDPIDAVRSAVSETYVSRCAVAALPTFVVPTLTRTPTPPPPTATATLAPGVTPSPTTIVPTATADPLAAVGEWEDPRRFNLLVLGIDQRTGVVEEEQYFRTDTIMIVSIDPARKTAGVLSIPRDLWVEIPGFTAGRINTANALGDANAYPGGGPQLAADTVQSALGIDIDGYVRINFDVFTRVVNLVAPGGTQVCPREVIDDPYYPDAGYGFIHVHFDPGCQRLDAERLLQYARTRKTEGGDFDRARRQQEVLRALQEEVLSAGGIANFITQVPTLWDELSGSYVTNLSLDDLLRLAVLGSEIERDQIAFGVIDNMHVQFATTNTGDQVLLPNYGAIRQLVAETFTRREAYTLAELKERAEAEGARIVVYNNTDTQGLARNTQEWLTSRGVRVDSVGNMPTPANVDTAVLLYTNKLWTARYLAALLGIPEDRIGRGTDGLTSADVMVSVGTDIQQLMTQGG